MQGTLYTLGYATPGAMDQLDRWMADPGVLLVDIRYVPRSRWYPQWNRKQLQARWQDRYTHEWNLGNVNYKDRAKPVQLVKPGPSVENAVRLLREGVSLILLCVCRDYERCHRKVVVECIRAAMPEVEVRHDAV